MIGTSSPTLKSLLPDDDRDPLELEPPDIVALMVKIKVILYDQQLEDKFHFLPRDDGLHTIKSEKVPPTIDIFS
ncbi:hypothetical protein PRNP1_010383 [Phytophthora ramorum]